MQIEVIAFDADDTLWHNESLYVNAQTKLKQILADYHPPEWVDEHLYQTEMRNLAHFGYGIKSFALSMIETAVELTDGQITGNDIRTIIDITKEMLSADVMLEYVAETLVGLRHNYTLMVITKGDLRDQEMKITRSGLAPHFRYIEIVSEKSRDTYKTILQRYSIEPERFLMVGNSLRSDILPVLELGASAVYVPHHLTWVHETSETSPAEQSGYYEIEHLGLLPALLKQLER